MTPIHRLPSAQRWAHEKDALGQSLYYAALMVSGEPGRHWEAIADERREYWRTLAEAAIRRGLEDDIKPHQARSVDYFSTAVQITREHASKIAGSISPSEPFGRARGDQ